MKHTLAAGLLFALALTFGVTAHAQDEAASSNSTVSANVGNGFTCGRASTAIACYSVPANIGGTFTFSVYPNGYNNSGRNFGYVLFNGVADLSYATVTSASYANNGLTFNFTGATDDGDKVSGTATMTFTYYTAGGGGGKGYGCPCSIRVLTGATLTITYN
jgi:hypothetical protein